MSQKALREQAIAAIREHMEEHGSSKWELIRPKYGRVAESTWWRWVGMAKNEGVRDSAVQVAEEAREVKSGKKPPPVQMPKRVTVESEYVPKVMPRDPVVPSPKSVSLPMAADRTQYTLKKARNIDVLDEIMRALQGADKLERFACHQDGNRKGEIKLAKVFQHAQLLRLRAASVYVEAFHAVWDIKRIQLLHNLIVEAVGRASPEMAQEIIERLSSADALYSAAAGGDPIMGKADAIESA